jgi:hypothetical protein
VQNQAIKNKQTIYACKQALFREQIPTQKEFLQRFTAVA